MPSKKFSRGWSNAACTSKLHTYRINIEIFPSRQRQHFRVTRHLSNEMYKGLEKQLSLRFAENVAIIILKRDVRYFKEIIWKKIKLYNHKIYKINRKKNKIK
ncbi:hypothetical protein PUN28_009198 [Cardiocondyla obscurior]|uniref:Uncharacterized protein n=1 Tax=Cardiocondyla obscurior TaxID=286306 RepID=A0AAW2FT97_9HYME